MDIRQIKKLIDLINAETGVAEIEIKEGETSVRISRFSSVPQMQTMIMPAAATAPHPTPLGSAPAAAVHSSAPVTAEPTEQAHALTINSPMVGTFYAAASPDAAPFVKVGTRVKKGDIVCIIEAMKMFNQIEAECEGTVVQCLVDNGHPVEFGQPMFVVDEE